MNPRPTPGDNPPAQSDVAGNSNGLAVYDTERIDRWRRRRLAIEIIDRLLDIGFLALFVLILAEPLQTAVENLPLENRWIAMTCYTGAMLLTHQCVSFPLALYADIIAHANSTPISIHQLGWRRAKRSLDFSVIASLFLVCIVLIISVGGKFWWLPAAIGLSAAGLLWTFLLPLARWRFLGGLESLRGKPVWKIFQRLLMQSQQIPCGLFRIDDRHMESRVEAKLFGFGPTKRMLLSGPLLDEFTDEEIEVTLAHELGHIVYRHLAKLQLFNLLVVIGLFLACDLALRILLPHLDQAIQALPLTVVAIVWLVFHIFAIPATIAKNALVRRFETQCDKYALKLTGLADAYQTALIKMTASNRQDPDPLKSTVFLFHDHHALADRLKLAE